MYVQEKKWVFKKQTRDEKKGVATVVFLIMSGKDEMGWDGIIK